MYQFFVEPDQIRDKEILIRGGDVNHIKNVLRMRVGQELSVSNGVDGREYRCHIAAFQEDQICCELRFVKEEGTELPSRIYLLQGLPKADKMETIIQKAVELGVYQVVPVATHRSVVKLDEKKAAARTARWQSIAEAAAKQSRRGVIPLVQQVMNWEQALGFVREVSVKLIPYELAEDMDKTRAMLEGLKAGQDIAVFIGPEGGFEESEIASAMEAGAVPITLGRRILRTETAGMTVLSWLMYHLEIGGAPGSRGAYDSL
ncbi:MAG: 16S rRNA (uracil(1498)-N(3))-methyltransferase [Lachnospiraceae bacterium]|jgi:16S rRNA (uracil1498-N3)-methyltransferase|nr:16S rRNA (uracil(1498)-N(3))-methyltransferase [Lachnospiraceae bacterium]